MTLDNYPMDSRSFVLYICGSINAEISRTMVFLLLEMFPPSTFLLLLDRDTSGDSFSGDTSVWI